MYLIKTVDNRGIESCGYLTPDKVDMENYCVKLMTTLLGSIRKIRVYTCPEQKHYTVFVPHHGLAVWVPGMELTKEISVGHCPRNKPD